MKNWYRSIGLVVLLVVTVVFIARFMSLRSPRVLDGDRMVQLNTRIGPDYFIDLELGICFASYGGLVQIDASACHKLVIKHTELEY